MSLKSPPTTRRSAPSLNQLDLFANFADPTPIDQAPPTIESPPPPSGREPTPQPIADCSIATPAHTLPSTLEDVFAIIRARSRTGKFAEMASALTSVVRVLKGTSKEKMLSSDLREFPAEPEALNKLLRSANPVLVGMTRQRWGRVKSLLRAALAECGLSVLPGRDIKGLTPAWRAITAPVPRRLRYGLSGFLSFCSRQGVDPDGVGDETFLTFQEALDSALTETVPAQVFRATVKLWNEAAATVAGWPTQTDVPVSDGRRASLPAEAFPDCFRTDVEACLHQASDPDEFSPTYRTELRPATIKSRRGQIFFAARTLVASGFPIAEITSCAVLVQIDNAEAVLRRLRDEKRALSGKKDDKPPSIGVLAGTLTSIASRWVVAPPEDIARLKQLTKNLTPPRKGRTEKNRKRLQQFDNPKNVLALVNLPVLVQRRIERNRTGTCKEAVQMMRALAVQIELVAPIRLKNLVDLKHASHFRIVRHGRRNIVHLQIPREETKTGEPIDMTLPDETTRMLEKYLSTYRNRIAEGAGPYLFPGRGGARRTESSFSAAISKFIRKQTGLAVNMHLFRHFAVELYQRSHPEDAETPRKVLGHTTTKLIHTTYGSARTDEAFKKWDGVLADLCATGGATATKSARKSKGRSK